MPRSSRHNNASSRHKQQKYISSPRPSPPTQLPTPLPDEERLLIVHRQQQPESTTSDELIDFDTPTPPPIQLSLDIDIDQDHHTYRSPPFREANLPHIESEDKAHSPPPLPVPPRIYHSDHDSHTDGHTRSPTYSSPNTRSSSRSTSNSLFNNYPSSSSSLPTTTPNTRSPSRHSPSRIPLPNTFNSLTQTLRSYVPSSIHIPIPSAAPSPPLVSRPISFGKFTNDNTPSSRLSGLGFVDRQDARGRVVSKQEFERDYEGEEYYAYGGYGYAQQQDERPQNTPRVSGALEKPSGLDIIKWAKWDVLGDRRFLILAYETGLQIWDSSDLGAISEVLNLNFDTAGWRMVFGSGDGSARKKSEEEGMVMKVVHAALLPAAADVRLDLFAGDRPLLGILMQMDGGEDEEYCDSSFILYSLRNHQLVKRLGLSGPCSNFTPNDQFIVVSLVSPPTLLVLSSTTLQTLYIVPPTLLEPFSPLPHHHYYYSATATSTSSSTTLGPPPTSPTTIVPDDNHRVGREPPHPVYALSRRLLVYASPSPFSISSSPLSIPTTSPRPSTTSNTTPSLSSSNPTTAAGTLGMVGRKVSTITQAELGHAAIKVGESVLGGMLMLGGMAYDAAKNRVVSNNTGGRLISRSAPESDGDRTRRVGERTAGAGTTVVPSGTVGSGGVGGYYITVVDLSPLLVMGKKLPTPIAEFMTSRSQPVAALEVSADGMSVGVIQRDGYVVKVFKIRPLASVVIIENDDDQSKKRHRWSGGVMSNAEQVYTLRRGLTSAVVEGADWSRDGRWMAIGSRKRTVHVFAVNPYGGKADIASHLEGRVKNVDVISHPVTELAPLVRLRGAKHNAEHPAAPLAFTFITPLDIAHSPRLQPSPAQQQFQDVLLFDPADGVLSLRRLCLDKHFVREGGGQGMAGAAAAAAVAAASVQAAVTSISLPGMGGAGKFAAAAPASTSRSVDEELVGKESVPVVATWHLQRRTDWVEIKRRISDLTSASSRAGRDWLAEAELSTFSKSRQILPRSIYLSHQFSFHTLGEDYHALIRRYQFDHIRGEEIKVRKQVEISAFSPSAEGVKFFSAPRDIHRHSSNNNTDHNVSSSSFDEPLASAISGSFDNFKLSPILPMYPNGTPGSVGSSAGGTAKLRNSIPIRTMAAGIGDGVSEGLGRLRREMNKVRSPMLVPLSSPPGPVPLEFDEEDDDFIVRDVLSPLVLGPPQPLTAVAAVDDDDDDEGVVWSSSAWDQQDALAVDEAEQFDDISAVGYLDEEQQQVRVQQKRKGRQKR